jgi:formate/nitrite transporter FocA (FNT family)
MPPEDTSRRTADQIFDVVRDAGRRELERGSLALAFSGLTGGMTMGLTGLGTALLQSQLGDTGFAQMITFLLYPVGFIAVIIGRGQLFTENTLYPVVLLLDERGHLRNALRLWTVVFAANVAGTVLFAIVATRTSALTPAVQSALARLGQQSGDRSFGSAFWTGVIGGWLIALVAWLVSASHWTIAQFAVTYLLTYLVGVGHFAHCIAGSGEVLSAVLLGSTTFGVYLRWLGGATLGNILGGVLIVTLFNYGQVVADND